MNQSWETPTTARRRSGDLTFATVSQIFPVVLDAGRPGLAGLSSKARHYRCLFAKVSGRTCLRPCSIIGAARFRFQGGWPARDQRRGLITPGARVPRICSPNPAAREVPMNIERVLCIAILAIIVVWLAERLL